MWHVVLMGLFCWFWTRNTFIYLIWIYPYVSKSDLMSTVTFKKKLSITTTTVPSYYHFCQRELYFRCCIALKLNVVKMIHKNSKRYRGAPHDRVKCGKILKAHSPRCLENTFPEFFHIKLSFLHLIANGLNEATINSLT